MTSPRSSLDSKSTSDSYTSTNMNGRADGFKFDSMEDALEAFTRGEFLVVMDDEGRENEGDLIIAASQCTTEKMAWMIKHTRCARFLSVRETLSEPRENSSGYICIALPRQRLEELEIPMMVAENEDPHRTAYTITVDYKHGTQIIPPTILPQKTRFTRPPTSLKPGTTTGISAHDRALTARNLADSKSKPSDFSKPGHMVPLRAREGGVLTRRGHTESAVDLCKLTGLPIAGLLCEIVNDDEQGTMSRRDDCRAFADRWGVKMISVEMLVEWRRKVEAEAATKGLEDFEL